MNILQIAMVCHEANRALCEGNNDFSQKTWQEAEEWQRTSAINGVEFKLKNPDATPEDQHKAWCADKYAAGWNHGDIKDAEKKTHPCLVPYNMLPIEQQAKDHVFTSIVSCLKPFLI